MEVKAGVTLHPDDMTRIFWDGPGFYAGAYDGYCDRYVYYRMEDGTPSQRDLQARQMGLGTPIEWVKPPEQTTE